MTNILVGMTMIVCGLMIYDYIHMTKNNKQPTILQWTNRLIEHIEPENIVEASKRFHDLIKSGLTPAHAFEVTVRT